MYDLALIDVRMPVMNGFGLYNEIRKLDIKVKICFLTAAEDTYYETFRKQAYPNYDENCIIRKPIGNEVVLYLVVYSDDDDDKHAHHDYRAQ